MGTVAHYLEVNVPAAKAYGWWRGLTNLPRILPDVESVEFGATSQLTHWRVRGPLGRPIEWDAKITEDIPNQRIAWTSVEGEQTQVRNAGAVSFDDHGQSTGVEVSLTYEPPAGALGAAVATMFADPQASVERALAAFKEAIELSLGAPPGTRPSTPDPSVPPGSRPSSQSTAPERSRPQPSSPADQQTSRPADQQTSNKEQR